MRARRSWSRLSAVLTAVALVGAGAVSLPLLGPTAALAAPGDATPRPDDAPVATSPLDTANPCDRTVVPPPGADGTTCMLPFPNNLFTTGTGPARRLNLPLAGMPKNAAGKPINPLPYADSDGFSPGQLIVVKVPGLDNPAAFARTGSVPITDLARYRDADAPVVVFDVQTGQRWPIWTEIDVNPLLPLAQGSASGLVTGEAAGQTGQPAPQTGAPNPARPFNTANVNLLIRPAKNFVNGHRYVVALRNLKDADGAPIGATEGFKVYRDHTALADLDPRTQRYDRDVFPVTDSAGIARSSLYQAWDFSVASQQNIAGRLLHLRDDAFAQLDDTKLDDRVVEGKAPAFTVNAPTVDDQGQRTITGTFTVPCYIDTARCAPGGEFAYSPDDPGRERPLQIPGNVSTPTFTCKVPRRVYDARTLEKVRPSLYGHGLLGGQGEVGQGQVRAMTSEHGFMYCATDWEGFATGDIGTVAQALADMDRFPAVIDHTQQGELNFLYLARLMIHPQGFGADPAFQVDKGAGLQSFIDPTRAYYDGNSQGGIYGGVVTAIAPDVDRGVLGVPGMNYSTLLRRSTDFALYAIPLYTSYPSEYERPLLLSVIQILWDRGDPNGYVNSLAPGQQLPNTPPHQVLYQAGFGDHQVANVTADNAARTIGAGIDPNPLESGRSPDVVQSFGVPRIGSYPYRGSGIVYFDIGPYVPDPGGDRGKDTGTPPAPTDNVAQQLGQDPHEAPRNSACGRVMKSNFLRPDGVVTNPCGGAPYFAFDYHGRDGQAGQGDTVRDGDALPYPGPSPACSPTPGASATASPGGTATPLPTATGAPSASGSPTASSSASASGSPTATGAPSAAGSPSASCSPAAPTGQRQAGGFHALRPTRVLDTRDDGGPVRAGTDRTVVLRARAGVPAGGVTTVIVNTTVTGVSRSMDLSVVPSGTRSGSRTSSLNAVAGQTVANLVAARLGPDGGIVLSVSAGQAHVVLDVLGWYDDGTGAAGDGYVAQVPERRYDSRSDAPVRAGSDRRIDLLAPRPAGATAAVVSLTALGATRPADVQLYAAGDRPAARTSTLNLRPGQTVANLAVVPVDSQGRVVVSVSSGTAQVVLDLLGYLTPSSTQTFTPTGPERILDTRTQRAPVTAGADRPVQVLGVGGVPSDGVSAVLVNVTSTGSSASADLQVYPTGQRPDRRTSNLNVRAGQTVPVLVLATVGPDGTISVSTSRGRMHVVVDVLGWVRSA